jgi:hypothetical protein
VLSRGGKARAGGVAPKVPPRIANRSAADQAHRDKLAKQWKTVEKPARRAYASMRPARRGAAGLIPDYPRLAKARKIRGDARFVSGNIEDQVTRLMRSPSRGKNKLTPQQRGQIVADTLYSARSLRARAAMTTPRRSTLKARAVRPSSTLAKPKGLNPGALAAKRTAKPAAPKRVTAARPAGAIAKTTRAGLKLGKNADGKFAWFSRDGKQRTGAYKTKREAQKSPEIEGKEQAARFKVRAKSSAKAKMDQKDYQNADSKWGRLNDSQIEKMIQRDTAAARSLQNNREFTGNNTRRYGPAMANQGAVEAFESARQAGRYLSERRVRKPRRKP